MFPIIFKKYFLEFKKKVVQTKIKGIRYIQIIRQFGLKNTFYIYPWFSQFKENNYPYHYQYYSIETKKTVIQSVLQSHNDQKIIKKFKLKNRRIIYFWFKEFQQSKNDHHFSRLNHYPFETKIKAVLALKKGNSYKQIQMKYGIKNISSIYSWQKWVDQNQIYRLHQKSGCNYRYQKKFCNDNENTIKKEIKKILGLNKKENKILYLKIISKYVYKIGLNQLLRWLNFSKSTYYRWLKKNNQPLFLTTLDLAIQKIAKRNCDYNSQGQRRYLLGYRRLHLKLLLIGFKVNLKTVYHKMKKFRCLCQTPKNSFFIRNYRRKKDYLPNHLPLTNLIQNNFQANSPYQKLCADITYFPYGKKHQFLFLSVIMDLYNREILSYTFSDKQDHQIIIQTLNHLPVLKKVGLFHSDQGTPFIHQHVQALLKEKNLIPSFSEKSSPQQNSCVEAFFSNLKGERFFEEKRKFLTPQRIKQKVTRFIEHYNQKRRLKYLGYLSPNQFKKQHLKQI
ncbi:integrase core domain protein [Candidatus Phytoplasma oryzae]|uniref:Integrase core domain protein n=1 Tax=Candidatus Phytoplasma oryzae TaxID=203274 RepID=A0A139JQ36_9MOLU|nr:IS3 family transposase [Candidatus Phytoplasma oryzae]KXT29062.1 integrase core domain protein [Candidatus Phytoplasma oryzae]KXT29087.1 integrase core domain protein [Candidatus Phytoplasma oryzae]KXT29217.1 integrase core domain protein [Candidatus Phytoplasma oryzae]RAM57690.1 hypothetical protein DH96_01940 [Candidatus Phytoplasma oryzae]